MYFIETKLYVALRKQAPTDKKKIYNWLIRKLTKSKYHHVELIMDDLWISSSSVTGGFRVRKLCNDINRDKRYDYIDLGTVIITKEQKEIIERFIDSKKGSSYDYTGIIFSQLIPLSWHSRRRWFCSEIVIKLLQLFLIEKTLPLVPHEQSPGDIAKLFNIE